MRRWQCSIEPNMGSLQQSEDGQTAGYISPCLCFCISPFLSFIPSSLLGPAVCLKCHGPLLLSSPLPVLNVSSTSTYRTFVSSTVEDSDVRVWSRVTPEALSDLQPHPAHLPLNTNMHLCVHELIGVFGGRQYLNL